MASDVELKKIKKKYGEKFMHMCRDLFPTILEQEGALFAILENTFADNSRTLYEDIHENNLEIGFKNFIYSKVDIKEETIEVVEERTPYELLDEAGYNLYECKTEEDIQQFKKYFAPEETLCTFQGGRLNSCVVFFAVKKNVDEIKRENFKKPLREDEYGTSVMSIQFYKAGSCIVSIKNRYNHTVLNPDATYGNDLDNIMPGLGKSFQNLLLQRGLQFDRSNIERFRIPGYVVAGDGRYYKYNMEFLGKYFCPGNVIIDQGQIVNLGNPEKRILVDSFVIDLEHKSIENYIVDTLITVYEDSFPRTFKDSIEKIEVVRDKESQNGERIIRIKKKDTDAKIEIRIDKYNQMIEYINEDLEGVRENFLRYSRRLRRLILPNLKNAGRHFLGDNQGLEYLELPMLRVAHESFLFSNLNLVSADFPQLIKAKDAFLYSNKKIEQANFPKLQVAGNSFFGNNLRLKRLELPSLCRVGNNFLGENQELEYFSAPKLSSIGNDFLYANIRLKALQLPEVVHIGHNFLCCNKKFLKIKDMKLLKGLDNKRILIVKDGKVTYETLAELDKKSRMTVFEIKFAERFIKMREFINRHRRNRAQKEH